MLGRSQSYFRVRRPYTEASSGPLSRGLSIRPADSISPRCLKTIPIIRATARRARPSEGVRCARGPRQDLGAVDAGIRVVRGRRTVVENVRFEARAEQTLRGG